MAEILRKQSIFISIILGFLSGIIILMVDSIFYVRDPWWILMPLIFGILISILIFIISSESNDKDKIITSILFLILYSVIHWSSMFLFWVLGLGRRGM